MYLTIVAKWLYIDYISTQSGSPFSQGTVRCQMVSSHYTWTNVDISLSVLLNAFASDSCWADILPRRKINEIDILSHSPVTTNQNGNQGRIAQFVISMFKFFVHSYMTVCKCDVPVHGTLSVCSLLSFAILSLVYAFVGSRLINTGAVPGTIWARALPRAKQARTPVRPGIVRYLVHICGLFARVMAPCR